MTILNGSTSAVAPCNLACSVDRRLQDAEAITAMNPDWIIMQSRGGSMEPFIQDGDLIIVQSSGYEAVGEGMMVVFIDHEGDQVVHSIREKTPDGFIIGGINNPQADPGRVDANNFVGVVIGILRVDQRCRSISGPPQKLPVALCKAR